LIRGAQDACGFVPRLSARAEYRQYVNVDALAAGLGRLPCAGVYAVVAAAGVVTNGDRVGLD
jgi:hypothetical protein